MRGLLLSLLATATAFRDLQQLQVSRESDLESEALDFLKDIERNGLRRDYGSETVSDPKRVWKFLDLVDNEVLIPEYKKYGFSRTLSTSNGTAVIFGDLHGQLFNLFGHLLRVRKQLKAELKAKDTSWFKVNYKKHKYKKLTGSRLLFCDPRIQYVFMGDYVDRGERGVETLLLLFAYKALCPEQVVLLQGNHESKSAWQKYGFEREVRYKLGSREMVDKFAYVLQGLPFVAVAPKNYMAVHGGITEAFVANCSGKAGNFSECIDYKTGVFMTWSDPGDFSFTGFGSNKRGPGIETFGLDVAAKFLESNDLKVLLRGHEQFDKGINMQQTEDKGVYTVFSAADYVGVFCIQGNDRPVRAPYFYEEMFRAGGSGNLGAIMITRFEDGQVVHMEASKSTGDENRQLAMDFTGADCGDWSKIQQKGWFAMFLEEGEEQAKGKRQLTSCHLSAEEQESHEEKVRTTLQEAKDIEFEARKLIDLQGEALNDDEEEICKTIQKDKITEKVYKEFSSKDEEVLEDDIEIREDELTHDN